MAHESVPSDSTPRGWLAGALGAAFAASACCLGPLVLAGLGLSAAGLSAGAARLRPLFLVVAAALLGRAFYVSYRRPAAACAPGAACETDPGRVRRTRAALWSATVLVALVAFFPAWGGRLLASRPAAGPAGPAIVLRIDGMTCEACAASVERELAHLPGVASARVSYEDGVGVVVLQPGARPQPDALVAAVGAAGYAASIADDAAAGDRAETAPRRGSS